MRHRRLYRTIETMAIVCRKCRDVRRVQIKIIVQEEKKG